MDNETSTELSTTDNSTALEIAIKRINDLHLSAEELASKAKNMAQETIAIALECGRLLIEQKKKIGHGNWLSWVQDNFTFSEDTAQRYMKLYRKTNELGVAENERSKTAHSQSVRYLENAKVKNLRQAYVATGILPEQPKDDSPKVLQLTPHVKHIDFLVLWYRKQTKTNPASKWTPFQREVLINDLAPLMEIFNALVELQEANQK